MKKIKVALAGNPNSGKTTIFNHLTGGRQHVGNYPGVTVEKKSGRCVFGDVEMEVVDLPGTYSLSAYSLDEKVARDFILNEQPDVVVGIVDASNIERNLYLVTQLIELQVPLALAFNMSDVARARGLAFNLERLSTSFTAPIVATVGNKNKGTRELCEAIVKVAGAAHPEATMIRYGRDVEREIAAIEGGVRDDAGLRQCFPSLFKRDGTRWLSVKLLEEDPEVTAAVSQPELRQRVEVATEHLASVLGDAPAVLIADRRYGYISGACQEAVRSTVELRHTRSDKIDSVMTHPVAGLPIFLVMMYLVFGLTFKVGEPLVRILERSFAWMAQRIDLAWPENAALGLKSLIVDGVIGGVGGVVIFVPIILLLFLAIAVLEYSGYMARAAFVVDRYMHRIGLHGKSFIPMLLGFGCSVPAIMATRMLDSRRDRLITMLVVPLMSCGARLPIYGLIIPAFFPAHLYTPMLWLIYMIGIALAVISAKLLGVFVFREETPGLVMELPPYRAPTLRSVWIYMWERAWLYLRKAGTIILAASVIMWVLTTYPKAAPPDSVPPGERKEYEISHSAAGRIGHAMEPVLRPLGFDWRIGTALIGAFAAKEVFVSQMGVVYSVGEIGEDPKSLREILRQRYTPLVGFCIMLFSLIGFPCVATVAITRVESGRWRWALLQLFGLTAIAYVVTLAVYQVGALFGG